MWVQRMQSIGNCVGGRADIRRLHHSKEALSLILVNISRLLPIVIMILTTGTPIGDVIRFRSVEYSLF